MFLCFSDTKKSAEVLEADHEEDIPQCYQRT